MLEKWKQELASKARPEKVWILSRFFKTGEGEYGYGDRFIGVNVPDNRAVSKKYADAPFDTIAGMLADPVHEYRLAGFLALVARYRKAPAETVNFYLANLHRANNWDLVDLSAPGILGEELRAGRLHDTARRMTHDSNLWIRRAAVVSTLRPVMKSHDTSLAIELCALLLTDRHDLMRKAVGWVLREVGKKDLPSMLAFLDIHIREISATTLSYAIEKLPPEIRADWRHRRKVQQNKSDELILPYGNS